MGWWRDDDVIKSIKGLNEGCEGNKFGTNND